MNCQAPLPVVRVVQAFSFAAESETDEQADNAEGSGDDFIPGVGGAQDESKDEHEKIERQDKQKKQRAAMAMVAKSTGKGAGPSTGAAAAAIKRASASINAAPGKAEPIAKRHKVTVASSKAVSVASAAAEAAAKALRSSGGNADALAAKKEDNEVRFFCRSWRLRDARTVKARRRCL